MFYAPTMTSPGYDQEQKTKPEIQKKIEEDDEKMTPEKAAEALLRGKCSHILFLLVELTILCGRRGEGASAHNCEPHYQVLYFVNTRVFSSVECLLDIRSGFGCMGKVFIYFLHTHANKHF